MFSSRRKGWTSLSRRSVILERLWPFSIGPAGTNELSKGIRDWAGFKNELLCKKIEGLCSSVHKRKVWDTVRIISYSQFPLVFYSIQFGTISQWVTLFFCFCFFLLVIRFLPKWSSWTEISWTVDTHTCLTALCAWSFNFELNLTLRLLGEYAYNIVSVRTCQWGDSIHIFPVCVFSTMEGKQLKILDLLPKHKLRAAGDSVFERGCHSDWLVPFGTCGRQWWNDAGLCCNRCSMSNNQALWKDEVEKTGGWSPGGLS